MSDMGLVAYVDNNAARYGLISGYSPVLFSGELISLSYLLDAKLGIFTWKSRVPSAATVADGPSRLDFSEIEEWAGAERCAPVVPCGGGQRLSRALAASVG